MTADNTKDPNLDPGDVKPENEIEIMPSDITVTASDLANVEHQYAYPEATPSDVIAVSTSADMGIRVQALEQQQFTEAIEEVKSSRIEELSLQFGPIKFSIKRGPKKVIKRFRSQSSSE